MHYLGMIFVTLFLTLFLAACNEDNATSKPAAVKTNNILDQTKKKLDKADKTYNTNLKKTIETGENGADQN